MFSYDGMGVMARREGPTGKPVYLHKDHLGNVTAVTDDNGNTLGEYEYYPFGELKSSATSLGAWRFTSQEWDNDITSYHFPARYYDPTWCRFMTPDPWTGMPDDERNLVVQGYVPRRQGGFHQQIAQERKSQSDPYYFIAKNKSQPAYLNFFNYGNNNPTKYTDEYGFFISDQCQTALSIAYRMAGTHHYHWIRPDLFRHCVASCMVSKMCGIVIAKQLSDLWEVKDWLEQNIFNKKTGGFCLDDLEANWCCGW